MSDNIHEKRIENFRRVVSQLPMHELIALQDRIKPIATDWSRRTDTGLGYKYDNAVEYIITDEYHIVRLEIQHRCEAYIAADEKEEEERRAKWGG